ncbi:response regulator transcription factor [Candidatus Methylospira mobilis]|uniref:Response regulator transcription factor n=1 Tax=Candidatus Methylospira mobilis TaxID=1808979 RepID=A0A5Q0BKA6_9GAMM|nr:response regulator transcription factor [Candidatus Methylospira mobilis]QFY42651.1 response regulator transcription factor [Candidatus Methylospira mobilis]WNV04231.1 response regulator transcription factor [Candidatus Methylospira mobilis]
MITAHILLIDDHAMFRTGLSLILGSGLPEAQIIEAGSLDTAIHNTLDNVDVVLLDINLPGLNGMDGIALLKRKWPRAPILILSSQDDAATVSMALVRGAAGFISKAATAEKIIESTRLALRGGFPVPSAATSRSSQRSLTPRQCEVLDLLNQGLSNKLIARQLSLSDNTVRRHVQDILEFFSVQSRAEAVFEARRRGLVGRSER